jgi:release factor glutamine methyltransferase
MAEPSLNYRQAQRAAAGELARLPQASAELEAALLLCHLLQVSRTHLLARPEQMLSREQQREYWALVQRRLDGEPIAHITGEREFWSLPLRVTPDTLIPRPESELLVARALAHADSIQAPHIADLGTGCGAIALALASERPDARIYATDRSAAALAVARGNAERLGLQGVSFFQGDWCSALPAGESYHLILSNPPYIAEQDPHLRQGDLPREPAGALISGRSGLRDIRRIAGQAPERLKPGGWLLLEHGNRQGPDVRQILQQNGFAHIDTLADLAAQPRVTEGCLQ